MRKALAVAERELRERWLFLPAGLAFGCVAFVLRAQGLTVNDTTLGLTLLVPMALAGAGSVIAGATMLARDAATGRLGFLFAQPLTWPSIWLGKWLAALMLGGATGLLAAIPWMMMYRSAGSGSWTSGMPQAPGAVSALLIFIILVGAANLGATSLLSRSAFVGLDLALVIVGVWGVRRFGFFLVCGAGEWRQTAMLLPAAVALLAASGVQVAVGRTDLHRAHRALSLALCGVVLPTLFAAAAYERWTFAAGPGELGYARTVAAQADGRWFQAMGTTTRSHCSIQSFLIDAARARYVALVDWELFELRPFERTGALVFAPNARLAVGWLSGSDHRSTALEVFDLSSAVPRASRVALQGISQPSWRSLLRLSPSGKTALLVLSPGTAALVDTSSGRALATAAVPSGYVAVQALCSSDTECRVWLSSEGTRVLRRVLDLGADGAARWSEFAEPVFRPGPTWSVGFVPVADGSRIVTFDSGVRLRDGKTGALLATLAKGGSSSGRPLSDGRIAVATDAEGRLRLALFDRDGSPLKNVDLGPEVHAVAMAEVSPGRVGVCVGPSPERGQTILVDLDQSRVVGSIDGLWPAGVSPRSGNDALVTPRPEGVSLFGGAQGQLVQINPATGERRIVAGPGAAKGERIDLP